MMDALLPTALMLLLTSGCCSGQDALPSSPLPGAVGGSVTFTTSLASTEKELDTIIWQFTTGSEAVVTVFNSTNNAPTGPEYNGRIGVDTFTGSLELRELTLKDSGNYRVNLIVSGTEHTGETTLGVYENITGISITGPTEALIAGKSSASLSCQATAGTIISREWLKDGDPLSPSNRTKFSEDNSSVSIDPLQGTDSGQYQCRLTNPVSTDTASYNLTVNFGPENVVINGEATPEVNSKLELICSAESVPPASFSWLVNGTARAANGSLVIENVSINDAGNYTCVASNNVTGLESSYVLPLTVTAPDPQPVPESSQSLSGGAIAGIVIGTIGGAGLIGGGGFFAYKKLFK